MNSKILSVFLIAFVLLGVLSVYFMGLFSLEIEEANYIVQTQNNDSGLLLFEFRDLRKTDIIHSVYTRPGDEYVLLINNTTKSADSPQMEIRFGVVSEQKLYKISTLSALEKVLSKYPKGGKLYEYDKCLSPTWYGIPREEVDAVYDVIEKNKFDRQKGDKDRRGFCTCSNFG